MASFATIVGSQKQENNAPLTGAEVTALELRMEQIIQRAMSVDKVGDTLRSTPGTEMISFLFRGQQFTAERETSKALLTLFRAARALENTMDRQGILRVNRTPTAPAPPVMLPLAIPRPVIAPPPQQTPAADCETENVDTTNLASVKDFIFNIPAVKELWVLLWPIFSVLKILGLATLKWAPRLVVWSIIFTTFSISSAVLANPAGVVRLMADCFLYIASLLPKYMIWFGKQFGEELLWQKGLLWNDPKSACPPCICPASEIGDAEQSSTGPFCPLPPSPDPAPSMTFSSQTVIMAVMAGLSLQKANGGNGGR